MTRDLIDIYVIASANEYEMANKSNCFDIYNGEYINFASYDEYKEFIIKSREIKDKLISNYYDKNNIE